MLSQRKRKNMKSITRVFYDVHNYRLLVGAPLAETDQPDVQKGGAVYKCNVDVADACQQIAFDRSGAHPFICLLISN